jgi:hypothetical protein
VTLFLRGMLIGDFNLIYKEYDKNYGRLNRQLVACSGMLQIT